MSADQAQPKTPFVPAPPVAAPPPGPSPVEPEADPVPGYEFVFGLAELEAQLGPIMGAPTESEHPDPDSCDTQQLTTTGLAYYRCVTNLVGFAAFPDGAMHWALAPLGAGLMEWTGDEEPPPDALTILASAPTADVDDPPRDISCLAAAPLPANMCVAGDSLSVLGAIQHPGDTLSVDLNVPASGLHLTAELIDLPADYDLYLADSSGTILGASIEEGSTPEHVEADLAGGTYYLYVHSDPGRSVDPQDPFRLLVSVS